MANAARDGASRLTRGRAVALGFGLFALVCLVVTWDFSKGRTPLTQSALIAEVLTATRPRACARDVGEIAARHFPTGLTREEAVKRLDALAIEKPGAWFWTPRLENATTWDGDQAEALRTIKTTAFGDELLRLHLSFSQGRLTRLAAEVVCRFG